MRKRFKFHKYVTMQRLNTNHHLNCKVNGYFFYFEEYFVISFEVGNFEFNNVKILMDIDYETIL